MGYTIGPKIELDGEAEYKVALTNLNKSMAAMRSEIKAVSSEFSNNANSMEALRSKNEVLKKAYDEAEKRVKLLRGALQNSNKEFGEASNISHDYANKLNKAQAELMKLDKELQSNGKHLNEAENSTDKTAKSIDEFGKKIEGAKEEVLDFGDILRANLASEAIIAGVKAVTGVIESLSKKSLKIGMDFEESMSLVASTMGMTKEEVENGAGAFKLLSDAAKEGGEKTKFSSTESAQALNYLALAGLDAAKSVEVLPKILDVAAAGELDLAYASDLVTDGMASLSLGVEELDTYIDQMAKTSQKSNTNIAQLGEATLVASGAVSAAKMSLTTMNAELGILADRGMKGAEGGTHLRNIILSLTSPTDKASDALSKLGVEVADGQGKIRDLNDIMTDFNSSLKYLSDAEKIELLSDVFNKTDLSAVNALLSGTTGQFKDLKEEIENSNDAAKIMAETMQANLKGKMEELGSVAEAVGITLYEKFDNAFKNMAQTGSESLGKLNRELGDGELGKSVDRLAESFEEATISVTDFALDALPDVIDGLSWILDNSTVVTSGLKGISAAFITKKVADGITYAISAYKTLTTVTQTATVAQTAFNTVSKANAIGAIASVVVGLGVALYSYSKSTANATSAMERANDSTLKLLDSSEMLRKETERGIQDRKEANNVIETQYGAVKVLTDNLYDLAEKENKTNSEKEQMLALVQQINKELPNLSLSIDEQTLSLSKQRGEIKLLVETQLELQKVQAAQNSLSTIGLSQYNEEKKLLELEKEKIDIQNSYARAKKNDEESFWKIGIEAGKRDKNLNKLLGSMSKNASEIIKTKNTIKELGEEYTETVAYIGDHGAIDEATESINEFGDVIEAATIKQRKNEIESLDDRKKGIKKAYEQTSKEVAKIHKAEQREFDKKQKAEVKAVQDTSKQVIDTLEKAHKIKMELIEKEYNEKIKKSNADKDKELQGIQGQIDDINNQTEAEDRAIKVRENAEKKAELEIQIASAETAEERLKATEDLAKLEKEVSREKIKEERKLQVEILDEQKDTITKKYEAEVEALKEVKTEEETIAKEKLEIATQLEKDKLDVKLEYLEEQQYWEREAFVETQTAYKELLAEQKELALKTAKETYDADLQAYRINNALKYDEAVAHEEKVRRLQQQNQTSYSYEDNYNSMRETIRQQPYTNPTYSQGSVFDRINKEITDFNYSLMEGAMTSALKKTNLTVEMNDKKVGVIIQDKVMRMVR